MLSYILNASTQKLNIVGLSVNFNKLHTKDYTHKDSIIRILSFHEYVNLW